MGCPKAYRDKIAAEMDAAKIHARTRGKREPRAFYCNMCKHWHLKEGK